MGVGMLRIAIRLGGDDDGMGQARAGSADHAVSADGAARGRYGGGADAAGAEGGGLACGGGAANDGGAVAAGAAAGGGGVGDCGGAGLQVGLGLGCVSERSPAPGISRSMRVGHRGPLWCGVWDLGAGPARGLGDGGGGRQTCDWTWE